MRKFTLDAAEFVAAVVPPGAFYALTSFMPPKVAGHRPSITVRMFNTTGELASYSTWANTKGGETYHSQASFRIAGPVPNKPGQLIGSKATDNIHSTRAFYMDMDCKRDGDKKEVGRSCFADKATAMKWLLGPLAAAGMPVPTYVVDSGYGLHAYWIADTVMPLQEWQPMANGLRALAEQHGFTGDGQITIDAARILRLPGSLNRKNPAVPQPVRVLGGAGNEIPLGTLRSVLLPHAGASAVPKPRAPSSNNVTALAGVRPTHIQGNTAVDMNAAAQEGVAGYDTPDKLSMARVASRCAVVGQVLATNGAGVRYNEWFPLVAMSAFCGDGAEYAHKLSSGDTTYTPADTDAKFASFQRDLTKPGHVGPARCTTLEPVHPAGCVGCPFRGRITSPLALGRVDLPGAFANQTSPDPATAPGDLPFGYFVDGGNILLRGAETADGPAEAKIAMHGTIADFTATEIIGTGGWTLRFTHTQGDTVRSITMPSSELTEHNKLHGLFMSRNIVAIDPEECRRTGRLLLAWMNKHINDRTAIKTAAVPSFGWSYTNGKPTGFSLSGTFYSGSDETPTHGVVDPVYSGIYRVTGGPAPWNAAFDLLAPHPNLATIVAASFAAPLMKFTGVTGVLLSHYSSASGVGKTSAVRTGQAVWGHSIAGVNNLADTVNSITNKLGTLGSLPIWWDEIRATEEAGKFSRLLFQLGQGRDVARLTSGATQQVVGSWHTLMVATGNTPLIDRINEIMQSTDAGSLRCFEWSHSGVPMASNPSAQAVFGSLENNHGHAGVAYARYLGAVASKLQALVDQTMIDTQVRLNAGNDERFFVAAITCLELGAAMANRAGVARFDLPALRVFLDETFRNLRRQRNMAGGGIIISQRGVNLDQMLAEYLSAVTQRRLVIDHLYDAGVPPGHLPIMKLQPVGPLGLAAVLAYDDGILRLPLAVLRKHLNDNKLPVSVIVGKMQTEWSAKQHVAVVGTGTPFAMARQSVIDIPIATNPTLHALVQHWTPKGTTP